MKGLMKSALIATLMIVSGAAMSVAPAHAETGNRVLVDIPFDFFVGNTSMEAGSYTVEEVQSGILAFTANDGHKHKFALAVRGDSTNRKQQPSLVFTRYGSEAFLNKVFLSAYGDCEQLVQSSREKKLIHGQASGEDLALLVQPVR